MNNKPYFSIVIPLYNKEKTILRTLESVFNQDYHNYEVVIIDDGSSDSSCEIVEGLHDERVHLYKQKNSGPGVARNHGVEKSKGDWILLLDADDRLLPNALRQFMELILHYPTISCFACNFYFYVNKDTKILYSNHYHNGVVKDNFKAWCLKKLMPRTGASVFRKEILLSYTYNTNYRRFEDADLIFRLFKNYKFVTNSYPVLEYDLTERNASLPLAEPEKDYCTQLKISNTSYWEKVAMYPLFQQALYLYAGAVKNIKFPLNVIMGDLYCRIIHKIDSIIRR